MTELPLAYRLQLTGTVLVEASAGTGKTFTLVRLLARHILWHGLSISQVLAVTFTRAASSELRVRLQALLHDTQQWLDTQACDGDLEHLYRARPGQVDDALFRQRLTQAIADADSAAVFTIHGFCQRLLQTFALDFGTALPMPALMENEAALHLRVSEEFWRQYAIDSERSLALSTAYGSPVAMAAKLAELMMPASLMPKARALPAPDMAAAAATLNIAMQLDDGESLLWYQRNISAGALNKKSHKPETIAEALSRLSVFLQNGGHGQAPDVSKLGRAALNFNKGKASEPPALLDAIDRWNAISEALAEYRIDQTVVMQHALRAFARKRLAELKSQENRIGYDDIVDSVFSVLDKDHHGQLARRILALFPVALVDEFQDTDARQWRIFERIYRQTQASSLVLIGDPKQAIYGFRGGDVHTYLQVHALADGHESLPVNYRSNAELLSGIDAVFSARPAPFLDTRIGFSPVSAGRDGTRLVREQTPVPAVAWIPVPSDTVMAIGEARAHLAEQCAKHLAGQLADSANGHLSVLEAGTQRPLLAADCVVLVRTHSEAGLMQAQLQRLGIASVCQRKDSLYSYYEAQDLLAVLQYLENPSARGAEVAARQGLLLQNAALTSPPLDCAEAVRLLKAHGPMACLLPVLHRAREGLLRLPDGDSHYGNYMHLLECLQNAHASQTGSDCSAWLARQIALESVPSERSPEPPRLTDANHRVRILTLHQSKGLEFGYVYLPFVAVRSRSQSGFAHYHDGTQRCLHMAAGSADEDIRARIQRESDAEQLRLLYVGMTRARFGLRLGIGPIKEFAKTPLAYLLGENAPDLLPCFPADPPATSPPNAIHSTMPDLQALKLLPAFSRAAYPWSITSFSALHQSQEKPRDLPADDETVAWQEYSGSAFQGADFGNAMHLVLEQAQPEDWRSITETGRKACAEALLRFGYNAAQSLEGAPVLAELVFNTLWAPLPEGCILANLAKSDVRHEMAFHMKLSNVPSAEVLALMHRFGYCRNRAQFGFQQTLNGLLTGKIDLCYRYDGKVYLLDYKSNGLQDYNDDALQVSIREQEYDLQYLIYCVALHRWLSQRRSDYSYAAHFGGVRYVYARGLVAELPGRGVFSDLPPAALIESLDQCFETGGGNAA